MIGRTMMWTWRTPLSVTIFCLLLLGAYTAVAVLVPAGPGRTAFGDIFQCLLPLLVNGILLMNAVTPNWRNNAFWMLLALGCSMWLGGQFIWTYTEVYKHGGTTAPFIGDIVFFLHTVPMIAALTIQPEVRDGNQKLKYGYVDFSLLLCWWVYLYLFFVIPWHYVVINDAHYRQTFNVICTFENLVFATGAALLSVRTTGRWRRIYAHLAGAGAMYTIASLLANLFIHRHEYSSGSLYDLPMIASLLWLGMAGVVAYTSGGQGYASRTDNPKGNSSGSAPRSEAVWASRLARAALFSLPLIGIWCVKTSDAPLALREFRIVVTLAAVLPLGFLVFLRHELIDAERLHLLRVSQESIDNLKRLQMQFVQAEKLASLGQLAAGAAHEINNPLTAILGYAELIQTDATASERSRTLGEKIREQARRTKVLVTNLLSFARQVPTEKQLLDLKSVVNSAIELRQLDLRDKKIRIDLDNPAVLPAVRGDPNQLLQVFYNLINNAVDAMETVGGGVLTVRMRTERGSVVLDFSDSGPGLRDPERVFDPFYTTKPVGKGTGLGLSICYGIVQEHGGQIFGFNRAEGGCTFRVILPAVLALFPQLAATTPVNTR